MTEATKLSRANQSYGALVEGIFIAGFTLERALQTLDSLIEGDDWKSVGSGFDNINAFLTSICLDGFRIVADDRKKIAARIKYLQPNASHRKIAKVLGIGKNTINRDLGPNEPVCETEPNGNGAETSSHGPIGPLSGQAAARAVQSTEAKNVRGTQGTADDEWYTPNEYINHARNALGQIDCDPASSEKAQEAVQASTYYNKFDNGLDHEWLGRIFLNPPYSQPDIGHFANRLISEIGNGHVTAAIMLTHNYTDTAWFQMLAKTASAICFTRGRVKFYSPKGEIAAPTQGQAFFYFGADVLAFQREFAPLGFIALMK